jgi:hypothetical protein
MNKFSSLALLFGLFFSLYASAQKQSYNLYMNNNIHNSYDQVKANQPYQIWLKDTASLKGYFDAVYESTFLFVTKDSTYVLRPEEVNFVAAISGFGDNSSYVKNNKGLKLASGVTLTTIGSIGVLASLGILSQDASAGAITAIISGTILTSGIALINASNSIKSKVNNFYYLSPENQKSPVKLRIFQTSSF